MFSASCSVKARRMGEDQRYSLRWNDFYTNIVSAFKTLKETEDFVDVTIACDGKSVKAHQVILSAASPFFRKLLKDNPCQHPIVILKDVRYQDMESLMSFMYHGEVQVSQEDLTEFLRAAQTLQIKGLTDVPHISPPRSPSESVTPPPLHIPEVRLGLESDERSCDSGKKRPHDDVEISPESKSEDNEAEKSTEDGQVAAADNSGNKAEQSGEPVTKKQKAQTEAKIIEGDNNNQTNGNTLVEGDKIKASLAANGNNGSILIQALEQGRQNYDKDEMSKLETGSSNAMMMDEDSSPDEADMKYDDKMDESGEELSAHALNEAMRFPAAAALLGFQGLPGFLPGPSSMQNNGGSSLDVSRRSLDMLRVRATDPRPCPKCGKIYRSAHTLRTHLEDKHTICPGYRCVLCGTVAKSRNSLHSHMSRQHRGISTKDLPVLPMPAPFDPQLAARLLAKAGVKFPANEIPSGRSSPPAPPMRRTGLEVTAIPSEKPTSPKSSRTSSATSMPLPPKIDPQTTGSAILDTYLQFIAENSLAHLGGQLQYAQQRAASLHRNALEKAGALQEQPPVPPPPQVVEVGGGGGGGSADAEESGDEDT